MRVRSLDVAAADQYRLLSFFPFYKTFKWFLLFYSAGIARVGYQMRKEKGKTDAEKIYYGIASAMDDLSRLLDDGGVYI